MFTANATSPLPFGAIATYRAITAVETVVEAIASWIQARHTRSVLSELSDRQLDDIGLARSDLY